ncbi:UNVERIFIED_CONTAM: hypothetical protein HDU68_011608 [Siphonaria sp. JEL0065]|nr:hypothetical protein HDU68_011608 [Siphonaria sp. JEL0065]
MDDTEAIETLDSIDTFELLDGSRISFLTCDSVDGPVVSSDTSSHFDRTGLFVWAGSKVMAHLMQTNRVCVSGKRVVELGSGGSGFLAALGVKCGAKAWIATDWGSSPVLKRLKENVDRNDIAETVKVVAYQSDNLPAILDANTLINPANSSPLNLVIAADVIYPSMSSPQILALLLSFKLLRDSPVTVITEFYCSYVNRDLSGDTLKRVLQVICEIPHLMVEVVEYDDQQVKQNTGGVVFRFWFEEVLSNTVRNTIIRAVGDQVMIGLWEKKKEIVEEWSAPFQSDEDEEE